MIITALTATVARQPVYCNHVAQSPALKLRSAVRQSAQRGFTLIELVVVIIIIVILMGVFMNRVLFYQEQAEKTAMEEVAGTIQSALLMQYSQVLTRGRSTDLNALVKDNPMRWMQKIPRNYAGEYYDPTPQTVASGSWMFDLKSRDLIYLLRNASHFKPSQEGIQWVRFHITAEYEQSRLPSLRDSAPELTGLLFKPVEPYHWF